MMSIKAFLRETVLALAVLALMFLSFGHQPPVFRLYGASAAVAAAVNCGGDAGGGAPAGRSRGCDVCRIATSVVLPQTPCVVLTGMVFTPVPPVVMPDQVLAGIPRTSGQGPRAPPART